MVLRHLVTLVWKAKHKVSKNCIPVCKALYIDEQLNILPRFQPVGYERLLKTYLNGYVTTSDAAKLP